MISSPLGTAIGGSLVAGIGATATLAASGIATIMLAVAGSVLWKERSGGGADSRNPRAQVEDDVGSVVPLPGGTDR